MTDEEIVDYIRLRLGGIDTLILSDSTILTLLYARQSQFEDEATVIYYTILDCLDYLIAFYTNQGSYSRLMQMEGSVMVDQQGVDYIGAWKQFRREFIRSPNIPGYSKVVGLPVFIGGVSKTEVKRVKDNLDSNYQGYSLNSFFD